MISTVELTRVGVLPQNEICDRSLPFRVSRYGVIRSDQTEYSTTRLPTVLPCESRHWHLDCSKLQSQFITRTGSPL